MTSWFWSLLNVYFKDLHLKLMLCYVMWNLLTVASLQFPNDSAITSLEVNQNRRDDITKLENEVTNIQMSLIGVLSTFLCLELTETF